MLALSSSYRYFLYGKSADMRCGFYSLAGLVRNELGQDPVSGDVFIFIGKRANQIRVVRKLGCCSWGLLFQIMLAEKEFDGSNVIVECLRKR